MPEALVIGLDCATPQFVLGEALSGLPNLRRLASAGLHGTLRSTDPPITVPAWTSMFTSYDAGMLGIYGFRNRRSYGYEDLYFANANAVRAKTLWRYLSGQRVRALVFGVPQTYPPRPLNGVMVSCFLTPDKNAPYTFPDEIKAELEAAADGDYILDVKDFRTDDKDALLRAVYQMTERRFKAVRHFLRRGEFDFAAMVEMGIDRLQHGFWRFCDPGHRLHAAGNRYETVLADYYRYVDEEVGRLLDAVGSDTTVLIVSDHGAQRMEGAICINEWLQKEGYLTLRDRPSSPVPLEPDMVDWSRTRAWGEGGYYSRVFLNVKGREPQGVVPADAYEAFRDELKARLEAIPDDAGRPIGTRALKPEEMYREVRNIPPDLIVYLGDLRWRSAGSVGTGTIHLFENDTGPDDANHAMEGIFIAAGPGVPADPRPGSYSIYDIAPTLMKRFGLDVPPDMIGKPIF
jgi:predicted AlkP superfamily phosphohydrolase/phosphomutase